MDNAVIDEVSFGPFRLSVRQRTLSTADGPIPLSSRAFDMLLALIECRHTSVSKDELMRRVWPNVVVEENNLHVQMAALRRALGEHHRSIVTIPGRGYRFVGNTDIIAEPAADALEPLPPKTPLTNLPAPVSALLGRNQELADICLLLSQARLVTLVGPGGVGKTKLARAAARSLLPGFPGGGWSVELGSITEPALVPATIAASLKIEELRQRSLIESLAAAFSRAPLLLLIDGCEHLLPAVADFAAALLQRCPELHILCTSQAPLGAEGEHIRRVAPLEIPESVSRASAAAALQVPAIRLFADRVSAGDGRFQLTDAMVAGAVEICRSLDGIPLAIELAAARVPLLGLEPVRSRIANRLALLGDDHAVRQDRHRTLRAAIEWSYGLLPEIDRQILRRLSIFAGGFTLIAAQEIAAGAGVADWDIVHSVGNLVRRSLLTCGPDLVMPRHRMLGSTREFAQEALIAASEYAAVAQRHVEHFCMLAEAWDAAWETSDAGDWIAPYSAELENFRAALSWSLSLSGDPELGCRLAAATGRFWFEAGHLSEGCRWIAEAIERAPADLPVLTLVMLHRGLADLSMAAGSAASAARKAVELATQLADPATLGVCQRMLGAALYRLGRYDEAETAELQAFELLRDTGHSRTYAKCLSDLCILRGGAGDYAAARRYNNEAQARLKALGDDRNAAICLQHAAEFEFAGGSITAAIALAEQSVALFRALNSRYSLEIGLANLAAYRLAAHEAETGREAVAEALIIAAEIDDQPGIAIAAETAALALALLGSAVSAAKLSGFAEASYRALSLDRQGTEQATRDRLTQALAERLAEPQLTQLKAEGGHLSIKMAIALTRG